MHRKILSIICILLTLVLVPISQVRAEEITNNRKIIIEDDANLLTEAEEIDLKNEMAVLTEYGNVVFKTSYTGEGKTALKFIQNYYYSILQNEKGVAFYIDMNRREVCTCATGGLEDIVTSSKCDTIMDNVYREAKNGKYYECAKKTFSQLNSLLSGKKIEEPMKYICNSILAVMISLFVTYGFFMLCSRNEKASKREIISECKASLKYTPLIVTKTGSHRVYSPSSDSGSGGGFSGGSFGGGRRWRIFWKWRKSWILEMY